jgi:hypothetical protein
VDELRAAGEDSLTWLKPFSPPYETSTVLRTMAANLPSNRSDMPRTFLKSADPARMIPDTLGESFVMNICVASSATCDNACILTGRERAMGEPQSKGWMGIGFGATEPPLERGTTPTLLRCTCSPRYGLHSHEQSHPLNEAQRPHVCGVHVVLVTDYTRMRATGRAWRNSGVSSTRVPFRPIGNQMHHCVYMYI